MDTDGPLFDVEHVSLGSEGDHPEGFGERALLLAPAATEDTIAQLLAALPPGRGLGYFDIRFPSPSDPGAFFYVWRTERDLRIAWGNHGWSTYAKRVDPADAAAHLWACMRQLPSPGTPRLSLTPPEFSWKHPPATLRSRLRRASDGPEPEATPGEDFEARLREIFTD